MTCQHKVDGGSSGPRFGESWTGEPAGPIHAFSKTEGPMLKEKAAGWGVPVRQRQRDALLSPHYHLFGLISNPASDDYF